MLLRRPAAGRIACDSGGTGQALRMVPKSGNEIPALNFDYVAGVLWKIPKHERL